MARRAFTEHPMFMQAGRAANAALQSAMADLGVSDVHLNDLHAGRVVDDLTRLLLNAHDFKQGREQLSRDFVVGKVG